MKKIILWGAWYGSKNVGDQLLLLSIADLIDKFLSGEKLFSVLTNEAEWINEYTARESECEFEVIQSRKQIWKVINSILQADLFVIGGGVPFFDQQSQVLVMLFLIFWVRLFRKPYMTWSVCSRDIKSWFAKAAYGWILNGAALITSRDEFTRDQFLNMGVNQTIYLTADSGFAFEHDFSRGEEILREAGWEQNGRPLAALTPRYLRKPDGEAETHYQIKRVDELQREVDCYAAALDWLWENGYQPIFIPMNTVMPDSDSRASEEVMAAARHGDKALMIDDVLRPRQVPGIYAKCQLSFVSRVHGSISSFLGGIPIMMYAFDNKHKSMMKNMGLEAYVLSGEDISPENTIQTLRKLISNSEEIRHQIKARTPELYQQALLPGELMVEMLKSKGRI